MAELLAPLAVSLDQRYQVPASFLMSGMLMRRGRGEPFELFDLAWRRSAWGFSCAGPIARQRARSHRVARPYRLPEGTVGPTASWLHCVFDGRWLWFGIELWTPMAVTPAGMIEEPRIGPGFVIVSGLLLPLRLLFRIKHRDSIENVR